MIIKLLPNSNKLAIFKQALKKRIVVYPRGGQLLWPTSIQ